MGDFGHGFGIAHMQHHFNNWRRQYQMMQTYLQKPQPMICLPRWDSRCQDDFGGQTGITPTFVSELKYQSCCSTTMPCQPTTQLLQQALREKQDSLGIFNTLYQFDTAGKFQRWRDPLKH